VRIRLTPTQRRSARWACQGMAVITAACTTHSTSAAVASEISVLTTTSA
jgi:hypothetical protein